VHHPMYIQGVSVGMVGGGGALLPGCRPWLGADHSPPSTAEVRS
jgi:hypothetical protein